VGITIHRELDKTLDAALDGVGLREEEAAAAAAAADGAGRHTSIQV
jgi:hypothetical protein